MMHWSDITAPLPLFPYIAASQPQPVRVPPWKRRLRRWALALTVSSLFFVLAAGPALLAGR